MGMGVNTAPPAAVPPGKTRYPLYRRFGGPQGGLDGCRKSRPTGTVQPVASRYTDSAIPALWVGE